MPGNLQSTSQHDLILSFIIKLVMQGENVPAKDLPLISSTLGSLYHSAFLISIHHFLQSHHLLLLVTSSIYTGFTRINKKATPISPSNFNKTPSQSLYFPLGISVHFPSVLINSIKSSISLASSFSHSPIYSSVHSKLLSSHNSKEHRYILIPKFDGQLPVYL